MTNDVYSTKIHRNSIKCCDKIENLNDHKVGKNSELTIIRCGKIIEMQVSGKLNCTTAVTPKDQPAILNNLNSTTAAINAGENYHDDVFKNFNEHGYIFGSTSPRGMSTSDYFVSSIPTNGAQVQPGTPLADNLQKDNNESDNNISSCSTLDIVNKVDNISLNALEVQIKELSQRLQKSECSRNEYKRKFEEITEEKERCSRRLEVISAAHESRITEMHCVIAELSKKLRTKQENTIVEENEPEGSEISYQEGSIYNSELNLTNPDAECQTDPLDGDYSVGVCGRAGGDDCLNRDENQKIFNETIAKTQVEALQEEVLHLRSQIALLQSQIANPFHTRNDNSDIVEECEAVEIYGNDVETDAANDGIIYRQALGNNAESCQTHELKLCPFGNEQNIENVSEVDYQISQSKSNKGKTNFHDPNTKKLLQLSSCNSKTNNSAIKSECHKNYVVTSNNVMMMMTTSNEYCTPLNNCSSIPSPQDAPPVPKMAERVKLRRTMENPDNVTATDLVHSDIKNTEIVEHLVSDLAQNNNMMESFVEASQLDTEFQRLHRRIEHLKMRNNVLSLTLQESKEHCDHLYLLCGKYESNAIALQLAVNCSDRAIEAYDVMLALLESKLAILKEKSESAEDSRKAVESVARHLLDRLESERDMSENSLGPWQNTFCISDKPLEPWTQEDDSRLRNHVSKLKGRRSTVQNTIVNLESPFSSFYEKSRIALESNKELKQEKNIQMDLEMAVLMQELLNLREENIQIKQKREEAERDRQFAMDKISILQNALQQLQTQLSADSDALFNLTAEDRTSYTEADHAALTERQLVEALTRESELKTRIQSLIGSVSASRKSSDEKYEAVQSNIKEIQKSNINLTQSLEQTKRKYQSRIRKLEQRIHEMNLELGQQNHHQQQHQQQKHRSNILNQENVPETTL